MKAFLLVVWIGGHSGYLTVDGLASEPACKDLYERLVERSAIYRKPYWCVEYDKAE